MRNALALDFPVEAGVHALTIRKACKLSGRPPKSVPSAIWHQQGVLSNFREANSVMSLRISIKGRAPLMLSRMAPRRRST